MREYKEEEVLQIAKRQGNKKRKYLLVDPLQAKHIPAPPTATVELFDTLAEKLKMRLLGESLVIAFAETATALGTEVAKAIGGCKYLQTTREDVEGVEKWLVFEEEHSHAVEQKISYDYLASAVETVDNVIIIDDELSTGKTLRNIIARMREEIPALGEKTVIVASIINRLSEENEALLSAEGIISEWLLKIPERNYDTMLDGIETAEAVEAKLADVDYLLTHSKKALPNPRAGVEIEEFSAACKEFAKELAPELAADGQKLLVLGTEECMYPAIALARELARKHGKEAYCHSTTRSPIGVRDETGYPIRNGYKLRSFYDEARTTYLYDLQKYDGVTVVSDAEDGERSAQQLFSAFAEYGCKKFRYVKVGKAFGSYKKADVTLLLKDVSGLVEPESTEVRERKIQSGTHYSEMLPIEYKPSREYFDIYEKALCAFAPAMAKAVASVTKKIIQSKGKEVVLVSLARAGIPIGILIKRYAKRFYGLDLPHYSISIIRGRGIDDNAMRYILKNHKPEHLQFVDGWTGKGAIFRQLEEAVAVYEGVSAGLAVVSDPACIAETYGTREDIFIASSCLNATVSGLLSRTFLRGDVIGESDFHGAAFYRQLREEDVSEAFLAAIERHFERNEDKKDEGEDAPFGAGLEEVKEIAAAYGVNDLNLVKPSIGEATRVLLRRLPERLLVYSLNDEERLGHLYRLAKEKGVPIEEYPLRRYRACGIIRSLADT